MGGCRHRRSWILGGLIEWCYECGALRRLIMLSETSVAPGSPWCKPVGRGAENPWDEWLRRTEAYRKRRALKGGE